MPIWNVVGHACQHDFSNNQRIASKERTYSMKQNGIALIKHMLRSLRSPDCNMIITGV